MKVLVVGNGAIAKNKGVYYVNKHTSNFLKELVEAGNEVGLLQSEEIIDTNMGLQNSPLDSRINIHTKFMTKKMGKFKKILFYLSMIELLKDNINNYDFIYIFYPGHVPVMAAFISRFFQKKYGLYVRGQQNLKTKIGKSIIRNSQFCLTVSPLLEKQLLNDNSDVAVIAPMIDFSKNDILNERLYSDNGYVQCLFVGRIELRKGIYDLMKAIDMLNTSSNDFRFNIVGGGESFFELSNEYENVDNVNFLGQISNTNELLAMYRQADLFIFPSHDEGFPRVLYEAMMARVPIITTMVGGIGGFMKNNHNCLAIEPERPDSIVRAVNQMLRSKTLKEKLVENATRDVLKLFDGSKKRHSKLLVTKLRGYSEFV